MSRPSGTSPPTLVGSTPKPALVAAGSASVQPSSGVHNRIDVFSLSLDDRMHGDLSEESDHAVEENVSLENENGSVESTNDDDNDQYNDNVNFNSEWCRENNCLEGALNIYMAKDSAEENLIDSEDEYRKSEDGSNIENDAKELFPYFNCVQQYDPNFELGMMFSNKKELRDAIHSHAIKNRRSVNITKNDKIRVYAKCADEECKWKLHALKLSGEYTFQIRKYVPEHTCVMNLYVKNLKSTWLSKKYMSKIRSDPKRNVKGFRTDIMEDVRCSVSKSQIYRAKAKATQLIEGQAYEQYALIWDFANEVKRSNPGSTIVIGTNDVTDENRHFIGVDGCHLKGPHGGVLLSAVGIDPNNSNFPIAIAIVNNESCETWGWFLSLLKLDLNIEKDYEWAFMSDKQKGLIQAFNEVFPRANHRFCLRHLHGNFKTAGFRGEAFKNALWKCGTATTVNEFRKKMAEMRDIDSSVADWFNDKPPMHWSRSHFTTNSICDFLLNNCCESFNSSILDAREKVILSMLEWLVEYFMMRMQVNRDRVEEKWEGLFCPRIRKLIEKNLTKTGDCIPIKADNFHYQVSCYDGSKYSVDLKEWTCGCRKWDLSGIPCNHALSAILAQRLDYFDYVHKCYSLATYKQVYSPIVMPLNGRSEWQPTGVIPVLPPNFGRLVGRPK
ncbi:hypothetical protein ZIOFF_033027 [Zingiber officinale]|uniref:SWIM-type domain-containing protein n=1 Tax=Zingiber officinale TaxID=94328 RepID=A0A8J5GJP2_ZINOF|nr:hypothetical protein ZIOFF_033027 [Zingiber officinale]